MARDLGLVAQGDRAAFRRLYAESSGKLFAICLQITRNRAAAEDVLQDVYLKIWQKAAGYDPARSRPLGWLGTIARNAAIDWYRASGKQKLVGDEHLNFIASEAEPVDDRIIRDEREQAALALVSELDEESEADLQRIYFQGLTFVQAAERLGVPLGTLKSRVRRTVIKLRRTIGDD